jgi:activator-of-BECN1-regulated-autophagy protein 1
MWPSVGRNPSQQTESTQERLDTSASVRLLTYSTPSGQYELLLSPIDSTNPPTQQEEPQSNENNVMESEPTNQLLPLVDSTHWELPFLQGWLIGQSQAGQQTVQPGDQVGGSGRSGPSRQRSSGQRDESGSQTAEIASSLAAAAAAELPCTVKLRIWPHNVEDPCAMLDSDKCRLIIPHAVLCSEMGAHFSPCGRFLAACVACVLPNMEAEPGFHGQIHLDVTGAATSPTRHPISAHQVLYELRIYSLEEATFGSVLSSRAIRAAHCLTSIQFSPTSEHLLLAYGRRHSSLLKSVVIDGETTVSIYTILEVYRVSDMELVRVLPSSEDEVNVACFHPSIGGGLVYGTKEGKLRILQYDFSQGLTYTAPSSSDQNMLEIPTHASEG